MIRRLRKRFIVSCIISVYVVFIAVFLLITSMESRQVNGTIDTLADVITANGGSLPAFSEMENYFPDTADPLRFREMITPESEFTTLFFAVWLDENGKILKSNTDSVHALEESELESFARSGHEGKKERGWIGNYRYIKSVTDTTELIVFVNGVQLRTHMQHFLKMCAISLLGISLFVLLMIIMISGRAISPVVKAYDRQKQFITDANHELKTPLTLIMSNLDIIEAENGESEWITDARDEGSRMVKLINQLTTLSQLDETMSKDNFTSFDLSRAVLETASEFEPAAKAHRKAMKIEIQPDVLYSGNEDLLQRLVSVLLDNAVKYCDSGGQILVRLTETRYPVISVENTFRRVDKLELDRLFDRFYRADPSRTGSESFGVGLSIAQSIVERHHGTISAYRKEGIIGFKTVLK